VVGYFLLNASGEKLTHSAFCINKCRVVGVGATMRSFFPHDQLTRFFQREPRLRGGGGA
jgi:hypothetical protein